MWRKAKKDNLYTQMNIRFFTEMKIESKNCSISIFIFLKIKAKKFNTNVLLFVFFFIQITRKQNVKFLFNSFNFQVC